LAGTANAQFEFFGALVIVWVLKGLLMNVGGPAQMYDFQRFLAARNERDAAKLGAAWSFFLIVRWALVSGIVLLALTGVTGVSDTEKVMPIVLRDFIPLGVRGVVIAGLLAAFMSTFSSTVNSGASFIVRDLWQPSLRKTPSEKRSVHFSYLATVLLVVFGVVIGFQSGSIAEIWNWMMMALGGGVLIPNVLRWYWWRMNGWGYALGTLGGIFFAVLALFIDGIPTYVIFPLIVSASFLLSVVGSLLTKPVEKPTLIDFYTTVRPFGYWKVVRNISGLTAIQLHDKKEKGTRAVLNVFLGMVAITSSYLMPMYLVGHWYGKAFLCLGCALVAVFALRFTWYQHLKSD
jgi:Na+/proline symporter